MSTKLQEFMKIEQKLKEQMAELEKMKKSKPVQKELQFKDDLEKLMKKHGKSYQDLGRTVQMMASATPQTRSTTKATTKRTRAPRKLKVYLNPYTGERVETRGGNHNTLKAWKTEYGPETVEGWANVQG